LSTSSRRFSTFCGLVAACLFFLGGLMGQYHIHKVIQTLDITSRAQLGRAPDDQLVPA
jgi:hypothetical protein